VLTLVGVSWSRLDPGRDNDNRRVIPWLAQAASCALLLPFSLTSHTVAVPGLRLEGVTTDFLHFLAAAVWAGSLFHFALAFPVLVSGASADDRSRLLGQVLPRFSALPCSSWGYWPLPGYIAPGLSWATSTDWQHPMGWHLPPNWLCSCQCWAWGR
jgi:hypothetical protein